MTGSVLRALRDVGLPASRAPDHGRHQPAADHERADVPPPVGDELLEVEHRARHLEGPAGPVGEVGVGHPHDPSALGAEERLDDDVAAERLERRQGVVDAFAHAGSRRGDARVLEERRREVFVHGALDAARRVDTGTPSRARRWSASIRKMTCSSEPLGIARTTTAPQSSSGRPAAVRRAPAPTLAASPVTGATTGSTPRSLSARPRRASCQPDRDPRMATFKRTPRRRTPEGRRG